MLGLNQQITYWAPNGETQFGGKTFAAPTIIQGRWEDRIELTTDAQGHEFVSHARIYLLQDVELQGYLYNGVSVVLDPRTITDTQEIRLKGSVPSVSALRRLYTAFI